jgi:hypothetical protein
MQKLSVKSLNLDHKILKPHIFTVQARRKHEGREEGDRPLLDQVEEIFRKAITTARPHSIILVGRLVGRLLDQVE